MNQEKQWCRIRLAENVGFSWAEYFSSVSVEPNDRGETVITGLLVDQTALHSTLGRIRDLGLTLLEVKILHERPEHGRKEKKS